MSLVPWRRCFHETLVPRDLGPGHQGGTEDRNRGASISRSLPFWVYLQDHKVDFRRSVEPSRSPTRAVLETAERSAREATRYHRSDPRTAGDGTFRYYKKHQDRGAYCLQKTDWARKGLLQEEISKIEKYLGDVETHRGQARKWREQHNAPEHPSPTPLTGQLITSLDSIFTLAATSRIQSKLEPHRFTHPPKSQTGTSSLEPFL